MEHVDVSLHCEESDIWCVSGNESIVAINTTALRQDFALSE